MRILVTGGCGFIGTNVVRHFAQDNQVMGLDNFSRSGSEDNLLYLRKNYVFDFRKVDITTFDFDNLPEVDVIIHLAGQVGVQKSINDPVDDFNQNCIGTLNILEYARRHTVKPVVIYASTNKVYGNLQVDMPVSESTPLDFHTPYGVSKGSADQYVLDYSRMYGIKGVVFRQSCIYGEWQNGSEDQGWIAWFLIADHKRLLITIYGDGNQRRDVLHVDDLMKAYELAIKNPKTWGQAYNIGGGEKNTLSLNELITKGEITTPLTFTDPRPDDQYYYVSDFTKFSTDTLWAPTIGVEEGIRRLKGFIHEN